MEEKPTFVRLRSKLLESGRLQFKRCMKVQNFICDGFSEFEGVQTAQYLRSEKNNVMLLNENQEVMVPLLDPKGSDCVTVVTYYHAYLMGSLNRSLMKR